jgi:hypothetical protein
LMFRWKTVCLKSNKFSTTRASHKYNVETGLRPVSTYINKNKQIEF